GSPISDFHQPRQLLGYLCRYKRPQEGTTVVTLADVARQAGVSLATASRVFSRPEKVGVETTGKVLEAADRLGYIANSTARALAMGSSGLLGLVVPKLSSSYLAPLISAVQSEVERSGFELIIVDSRGVPESEIEVARRLRGRVDGLIFASPRSSGTALANVALGFPIVTVNRDRKSTRLNSSHVSISYAVF